MPSIDPAHLRQIIRCTLLQLDMYSPAAEELLLGTSAHESHLGHWLMQYPHGPARGLYQMEPATEADIWDNYLYYRPERATLVTKLTGVIKPSILNLQFNPIYSTAMARLHYRRIEDPLPPADDIDALSCYWDQHYNRNDRKGFPSQFIDDYRRLVAATTPAPTAVAAHPVAIGCPD